MPTPYLKRLSRPTPPRRGRIAPGRARAERPSRPPSKRPAVPAATPTALPSWAELGRAEGGAVRPEGAGRLSTFRFAGLVALLATVFTLYVGHVHATRATLAELQAARRQNLELHQQAQRLRAAFDRLTAPSVIYERAAALGLEEDITYGPTIHEAPRR